MKNNKLRTEENINADLTKALEAYRSGVTEDSGKVSAEKAAKVKALQTELCSALSAGAKKCKCGAMPIGMRVNDHTIEVGCTICPPRFEIIPGETAKAKQISIGSRNVTVELAVKDWNAGKYFSKIVEIK